LATPRESWWPKTSQPGFGPGLTPMPRIPAGAWKARRLTGRPCTNPEHSITHHARISTLYSHPGKVGDARPLRRPDFGSQLHSKRWAFCVSVKPSPARNVLLR
jgi:hypothetical protein